MSYRRREKQLKSIKNVSEYLTTIEAAEYLELKGIPIHPHTLANWRHLADRDDYPSYYKLTNKVYYKPSDLDEWLESRLVEAR